MLVIALLYVLSYPVVVRAKYGRDAGLLFLFSAQEGLTVYRPVDWLIDRTPVRGPLFFWADRWGVREEFESMELARFQPITHMRFE